MAHRCGWMGRILAVLLASAMIVTSVPEAALTVHAAETTETVDAEVTAPVEEEAEDTVAEPVPMAEETASELEVELTETEASGSSTENAIPLYAGRRVSGEISGTVYFMATLEAKKLYFLKSAKCVEENDDPAHGFFELNYVNAAGRTITVFGRDAEYADNAEDSVVLIGGSEAACTVWFKVDAGKTKKKYDMMLCEAAVAYENVPSGENGRFSVKATVTVPEAADYTGSVSSALYMKMTYNNIVGDEILCTAYSDYAMTNGVMTVIGKSEADVEQGQTYEVNAEIAYYGARSYVCEQVLEAEVAVNTELDVSKFALNISAKENDAYTVSYTYDGVPLEKEVTLYYMPKVSGDCIWKKTAFTQGSGSVSVSSYNVSEGLPYQLYLYADGVLKKFGEDSDTYVFGTLVYEEPVIEITTGPCSAHIKYSLSAKDGYEFSSNISTGLYVYFRETGSNVWGKYVCGDMTLGADKKTFSSEIDIPGEDAKMMLRPETEYEFTFYWEGTGEAPGYTCVRTATTGEDRWTVETAVGATAVNCKIGLDKAVINSLTNLEIKFDVFYKKQGEKVFVRAADENGQPVCVTLSRYSTDGTDQKKIIGLVPGTKYDFELRTQYTNYKTVVKTFQVETLTADTRRFANEVSTPTDESCRISVSYAGETQGLNSRLMLFYRPKAEAGEEPADYVSVDAQKMYKSEDTYGLSCYKLVPETTYEYILAIADMVCYEPDDPRIAVTKEGTFTTTELTKKLQGVSVEPESSSAAINYSINNEGEDGVYLYVSAFYRKKADGGETFPWQKHIDDEGDYYSEGVTSQSINLEDLEKDTEYEFKLVVSTQVIAQADDTNHVIIVHEGTFTTLDDVIPGPPATPTGQLDDVRVESGVTSAKFIVTFSGCREDSYVYFSVFYREKDSADAYRLGTYMSSSDTAGTIDWMKISDLTPGKSYDYVVVMDGTDVSSYDETATYLDQAAGTFEIPVNRLKIKKASAYATYKSMRISAGFEGNDNQNNVYLIVFYRNKDKRDADFENRLIYQPYYDAAGDLVVERETDVAERFCDLEPGTTYEYYVLLHDNWEVDAVVDEAFFEKVDETRLSHGECTTRKAEYQAEVSYNESKSTADSTVLDLKLGGNSAAKKVDNTVRAEITCADEAGNEKIISGTVRSSMEYRAALETTTLTPGKTYTVKKVDLYVNEPIYIWHEETDDDGSKYWWREDGEESLLIQTLTGDGLMAESFRTKSYTTVPDSVMLQEEALYLNVNAGDGVLMATVTPAEAAKTIDCVAAPEKAGIARAVCEVAAGGICIVVHPIKPGEVTFNIVSTADGSQKVYASFTVQVVDYVLAAEPENGTPVVPAGQEKPIRIMKGSCSETLVLYGRESAEESYVKLEGKTLSLESGTNLVSWLQTESVLRGINIGRTEAVWLIDGKYPFKAAVEVEAVDTAFMIKELSNASYPAREAAYGKDTVSAIVAAGQAYQIEGYLAPSQQKIAQSDKLLYQVEGTETGVTVSEIGLIEIAPSDQGYDAVVRVSARPGENQIWNRQSATITLHVKPLPAVPDNIGYVLTNVAPTLRKVVFTEEYSGWEWEEPDDTKLFTTSASGAGDTRAFSAAYTREGSYPMRSAKVSMSVLTMTSAGVVLKDTDSGSESAGDLAVDLKDGKASVDFCVRPEGRNVSPYEVYDSLFGDSKYTYQLECTQNGSDGFVIGRYSDAVSAQNVAFTKAGTYDFTIKILSASGEKILTESRTVKVVDSRQVTGIMFRKATWNDDVKTDVTGLLTGDPYGNTRYVVDKEGAGKGLILTVETTDYSGAAITETPLKWESSDPAVAKIVSVDGRTAVIKNGGEGHASITVTAQDDRKVSASFLYEYRNMRPRVDKKTLKVNVAYDTDTDQGRYLAYYACKSYLEIAPVYGETIQSVKLYKKSLSTWKAQEAAGKEAVTAFSLEKYSGDNYLVKSKADAPTGKQSLWMVVKTNSVEEAYPLTINAFAKKPSVSVKTTGKINLFYINGYAQEFVSVTTGKDYYFNGDITVSWKSGNESEAGFTVDKYYYSRPSQYTCNYTVSDAGARVENRKLKVKNVAKGTLTVRLPGLRGEYGEVQKPLKIATGYTKPALVSERATSTIIRDVGANGYSFSIYNKTDNRYLTYRGSEYADEPGGCFNFTDITTDTADLVLEKYNNSSMVHYTYNGTRKTVRVSMTLDNDTCWREPLTVTHTIKDIAPKTELYPGDTIVINSTLDDYQLGTVKRGSGYAPNLYVYMKDHASLTTISELKIEGTDDAAKALLENDLIDLRQNSDPKLERYSDQNSFLTFRQNAARALGGKLEKGTYQYKITPYCRLMGGQSRALDPVTLSIKVVDEKISAATTAKGSLDIAKRGYFDSIYKKGKVSYVTDNVVKISTKFENLPSVYQYDCTLKGEYADCFDLCEFPAGSGDWYVGFKGIYNENNPYYSQAYNRFLKAGMDVSLSIDYTIKVPGSDGSFYAAETVNGGAFRVDITQSVPKVKVTKGNNQVLYAAAADDVERYATLTAQGGSEICDAFGSVDCNGDGKSDITVYYRGGSDSNIGIRILDMDAVKASSAGKVVKIPVTVRMRGADGFSGDGSAVIKVKVKR